MPKGHLNIYLKGISKMSVKKTEKKNVNPNKKYYIAIAIMSVCILALIVVMVWPYITPPYIDYSSQSQSEQESPKGEELPPITDENFLDVIDRSDAKKVEFTMTDGQKFVMEVYPKVAPITVENFLSLVDEGFYDGLTFHRIIDGFMAQGGAFDPIDQSNDPAAKIKGEFSSNGVENNLSHRRGVVSMARTNIPDSASSQFFICYGDASYLDGDYAAFGYVTEGMETVDSFLSAGTDANDMPLKEVKIKKAIRIN